MCRYNNKNNNNNNNKAMLFDDALSIGTIQRRMMG
jgi:hypothetical protein